ncbi:MAG: flippase [Pseudomonadota bacterium]
MATLRFFLFNLFGNMLPLIVALVAMPTVAHYAGVERLGVLAVVWTLVGYFGFLDFGLSRVVTRRLAKAAEQSRTAEELTHLRGFFWWWVFPCLILIALLFLAGRPFLSGLFHGASFKHELSAGWVWIAWCLPITLVTNWLRGALEGLQRFARINLLRAVFGSWTYAAPALTAIFHPTIDAMIIAVVSGRVLALMAHVVACKQVESGIVMGAVPRHGPGIRQFFKEGGWMSVSNLVSPMMVYFDRFILAALVPAEAVAWYATAQEGMLGMRLIPGALAGVLFPQFAAASDGGALRQITELYRLALRAIAALMLPACVLIATLSYDGMRWWMGDTFALHSYRVVAIVAIGLYANSIAQLPFAWLQGVGRSRITAQIHLLELPIYVFAVYVCVAHWGIEGAAWIWTVRMIVDCVLLLGMAPRGNDQFALMTGLLGGVLIAVAGLMAGPEWIWQWRAAACVLATVGAGFYAWFGLLNTTDRHSVMRLRHAY